MLLALTMACVGTPAVERVEPSFIEVTLGESVTEVAPPPIP